MIIWLNGTFGAGKTTIAQKINGQLKQSFIYDPENIGDIFRSNLPKEVQKNDFQDYKEWREWNFYLLKKIYKEYEGDIIVPMTLYKEAAFNDLIGELRNQNIPVCHVQLEVTRETIVERLNGRSASLIEWGISKVDEVLEEFKKVPDSEKVINEDAEIDDVTTEVMRKIEKYREKL